VKFTDPKSEIAIDLGINCRLAIENSKLIRDYLSIDERFKQLCFIIKYWAKRRKINDPYRGTLSSYAYVLLILNFLQMRTPPILPCLQEMARPSDRKTIKEFDVSYYRDVEQLKNYGAANKESIADLLAEFMAFYAYGFDYRSEVVSVRCGRFLTKSEKDWTQNKAKDRHLFCIEDPFDTTHDLGRVCDRQALHEIRGEFMRAHKELCESGDFREVCTQYTAEWRGS